MPKFLKNAQEASHFLLEKILKPGDLAIDATMGKGFDTLFLAQLVGPKGHVHAFDIQPQALSYTKEKLDRQGINQVSLHLIGHEHLDQVIGDSEVAGAIFNLGYLPAADKAIITKGETTLQAVSKILDRLKVGGLLVLVVYYGHPGGPEEKAMLEQYVAKLDQKAFQVAHYAFLNQVNQPPQLIAIEKL